MSEGKGDERRSALLEALDHHLQGDSSLDAINIADISRRAGVTRSAFYFYFDNKAAAVAALMDEMYDDGFGAAELIGGSGAMRERTATAIRAIFTTWGRRTHIYRAMLDARSSSPAVREQWAASQRSFVDVVTALIEDERAAGLAPSGVDSGSIATALLDLNDRTLERLVRSDEDFDWDQHLEAVVHVWLASIYGSTA